MPQAIQTINPTSDSHNQAGSNNGQSSIACSACGKPMEGPFVRALGAVFHLNCFKCMDCGIAVASKFFPIEGPDGKQNPLCERDYFGRLNLLCAKCGMAMRGSYTTACNKKYHVEHFTCSICPTVFGPQEFYYEHEGNAYCHFHYSTRFATKCPGCLCAVLKQFVKINRHNRDERWHPECFMIKKLWNVKISTRRPSAVTAPDRDQQQLQIQQQSPLPVYMEEEDKETPISLKEKQVRMEQQVYRIWMVLSAFEESTVGCISDMLRQVSNDAYLDALRIAERFILHIEVLFGTIDDLEWVFAERGIKGMAHVREARMLCQKTVDLFTLTQETGAPRMGMPQELLALVTGLAHYLKILIRTALIGALKLDREEAGGSQEVVYQQPQQLLTRANGAPLLAQGEAVDSFLDKLNSLMVQGGNPAARRMIQSANSSSSSTPKNLGTQGVIYGYQSLSPECAGESPFWNGAATAAGQSSSAEPSSNHARPSSYPGGGSPPTDVCVRCNVTVEEDCVRLGTYQRWHLHCVQCAHCSKVAAVEAPGQMLQQQGNGGESMPNANHPSSTSGSTSHIAPRVTTHRLPALVHEFMYASNSLRYMPSFGKVPVVILCTEHVHARCRGGFHAVTQLEQYAFLLNVALRRLHVTLRKQGVVPMLPVSSDPSAPISDPYSNWDRIMKMKSVYPSPRPSCTLPKPPIIVESRTGQNLQPSSSNTEQHEQQQVLQNYLPQLPHQHQREERHPQQVFPTINTSYTPPASKSVPQISKIQGITENPLSQKPKEPPFSGDLATNVVNNSLGRTNVIPQDVLERKELPAVPMQNSINLKEDEPFEFSDEDELESPTTSDDNQTVEPPFQSSQRDPTPWILASRKLHLPQKPLDAEFMLHLAALRRQCDSASLSSTNSTLQILGSCDSLDPAGFSDSSSVASLPLEDEDEFPPTPVFRDEIPKAFMTKVESPFFAGHTPKGSSASLFNSTHPPTPTGSVRRGYLNRRGDHLTPDGYVTFPPPSMQYPEELRMYLFENEGYRNHSGLFISYVRRPELPQSLSKYGNLPERPYESFVSYL